MICVCVVPQNTSIAGSELVFNVQSICTEAGKPADPFNINCVGRTCAQIDGIDAIALGFTINGKLLVTISNSCKLIISSIKNWYNGAGGKMSSSLTTRSGALL